MKFFAILILALLATTQVLWGQSGGRESLEQTYNAQRAATLMATHYNAATLQTLQKQVDVWAKLCLLENRNAENWFNYYMIVRQYQLQSNKGIISNEGEKSLTTIAAKMDSAIKQKSFETDVVHYFEAPNYEKATQYLTDAEKISPQHPIILPELVKYHHHTGNYTQRNLLLQKLPQIAPKTGLYALSKAMADNLPDSSCVITNGEYDTYALWLAALNAGKHITVYSLKFEGTEKGHSNNTTPNVSALQKVLTTIPKNKSVYISLTVNPDYYSAILPQLYNMGVCYQYSASAVDNISFAHNAIVEKQPVSPYPSTGTEVLKNLMPGYIVLYRHYKTTDTTKAAQTKQAAKDFAQHLGFWNDYQSYFN